MKKEFFYSVTAHAVLLFLLAGKLPGCGGGGSAKSGGHPQDNRPIVDRAVEVELNEPESAGISQNKPNNEPSPKPSAKYVDRDCSGYQWFGGVGLSMNALTGTSYAVVDKASYGYPAQRAGVLPGDEILNFSDLRGEPGTEVIIKVYRNGQFMPFTVVREKICLENAK